MQGRSKLILHLSGIVVMVVVAVFCEPMLAPLESPSIDQFGVHQSNVNHPSSETITSLRLPLPPKIQTVAIEPGAYYAGGTAYDWLVMKLLGGHWTETDPLYVLKEHGMIWNRIGVCIKNSPISSPDSWCSIEYAEEVMDASVENGMRLDLFFYLSHTAAHAGQQPCPPEWAAFNITEKAEALRQYCYNTTKYYKEKGFDIEIYEMGNEIDFGILDERPPVGVDVFNTAWMKANIWNKEAEMLKGAIAGVKQADPNATILLHLGVSYHPNFVAGFVNAMIDFNVPFDLIGLSFYPTWTGAGCPTMATLQSCVEEIANLEKKTMICEFLYPSSPNPDFPSYDKPVTGYPLTPEGQALFVRYFLEWCYYNPDIIGAIYFYPDNHLSETEPEIHGASGSHSALFFNDTTIKPALNEFLRFGFPTWLVPPPDQILEFGLPLHYDLKATDPWESGNWQLNDTSHFAIDRLGIVTNATMLAVGTYGLEVWFNDTYGNSLTGAFTVIVQDTTPPSWDTVPSDQIVQYGQALDYQLSATDLSGIDHWNLNDTVHFAISATGRVVNITTLNLGSYGLNVTVFDIYDNYCSASFTVTVLQPSSSSSSTQASFAGAIAFGALVVLSVEFVVRRRKKQSLK